MPSIPTFLAANMFQTNFGRMSQQLFDLQEQTSTGYKADDLKGYAADATRIISSKSLIADNESRVAASQRLGARLSIQDLALSQTSSVVSDLRTAVSTAVISGRAGELKSLLEISFVQVHSALNTQHEEQYLFAGDRRDVPPIAVDSLRDLGYVDDISTIFRESDRDQRADLGGGISIKVSDRASTFSAEVFEAMRDIFHIVGSLPADATLTQAETEALTEIDATLSEAHANVLQAQGRNGVVQKRLEADIERLKSNNITIGGRLAEIMEADLGEVAAQLSAVRTQYEAAAKVFSQMRELTLVNFLD
jgi:flagellar hook-associated protein 3 FlgL